MPSISQGSPTLCESPDLAQPSEEIEWPSNYQISKGYGRPCQRPGPVVPGRLNSGSGKAYQLNVFRSICSKVCSCSCHRYNRLASPQILANVVGALSIGFVGWPAFRQPCSERGCSAQTDAFVRIGYRFPPWILNRVIFALVSSTAMMGPSMFLGMLRVVPDDEKVFVYAEKGDIEGIKTLFSNGAASVYDVDSAGQSLLDVRCHLLSPSSIV